MANAYYRSLYFSLDSPEDVELLGLLLALPRWRRPSAIKTALRHYLPTLLDGPPLRPEEVRTIIANPARVRGHRRAPSRPTAPRPESPGHEEALERETPEGISRAEDVADVQTAETAEQLLKSRLDQLMKSRWIG